MLSFLINFASLVAVAAYSKRDLFVGVSRKKANEGSDSSLAFVAKLEFASVTIAPLPEGYPLPKVIWGIETNGKPDYETIVAAQLDTWAKNFPRQELAIVGGRFDDAKVNDSWASTVPPNKCEDTRAQLSCKEAVLLDRGAERVKALGADWLMVGQEDKYLWTHTVQRALAQLDANKPQVLGSFGCGQGWAHHKESLNGTLPRPRGWGEPGMSCKAVFEHGGLCGGPTYYVSRGALNLLRKQSQTSDDFVKEYLGLATGDRGASDLFSSCLFYNRGIPQSTFQRTTGDFANIPQPTPEKLNEVGHQMKAGNLLAAHLSGNKAKIPDLIYSLAKM